MELYKANSKASFGIIGINSVGEAKANTKRFRVYSRCIAEEIGIIKFVHKDYGEQSLYVLINREEIANDPDFVLKIEGVIKPLISDYFKGEEEEPTKVNRRRR